MSAKEIPSMLKLFSGLCGAMPLLMPAVMAQEMAALG